MYAKAIGGGSSDLANAIAVDGSGNMYITGHFSGTIDFDPGAGTANLVSLGGSPDIFFAKYDINGNYVYAKSIGSGGLDEGFSIAVDGSSNVYVLGIFQGTADFDPSAGIVDLTSTGGSLDVFFAKYDASGNYVYAKALGGTFNDSPSGLAVDASGNVYVIGSFQSTGDFDPGAGTANLISSGSQDIFFAKYDASGNYVYAKSIGGTSIDIARGIAVDGSGNICVTGYFSGTADFDPGAAPVNLTSAGSNDIFFAKYDASGNYMYAKVIGGTSGDIAQGIVLDGSSNIYVTGYFQGTVDFDPGGGTVNLTSAGSFDIFFAKYDINGNYVYAKAMGGTGGDTGNGITLDGSGNVYVAGTFASTVDFDPGAGTAILVAGGTSTNSFVSSYNNSGNYRNAGLLGGYSNTPLSDRGRSVAIDGSGNVYITGQFTGTLDFDPGAGTVNLTSAGGTDIYFAKYDANGNLVYARSIGGTGFDVGYGITVDGSGNVYITGSFSGTADFDPGAGTVNLTSAGGTDIYFAKYDVSGNFVYARRMGNTTNDVGFGIVVDGSGNVYVAGTFTSTVDFDPGAGTVNLTSAGGIDFFFAKYNSTGNYVYARAVGGVSSDLVYDIEVDGSGNVYVTGTFALTVDFDPGAGTANLTGAGSNDIFFAKYNASGNYVYAKALGGTSSDIANNIAVDGSGNVYVTGVFGSTVDFDPGAGTVNLTSAGFNDIFFAKYDASGNYVYAKSMGGSNFEEGNSIVVDGSGNVYITGAFQGTVDFDPGAGTANLISTGIYDLFFAKYDNNGNYIYVKQIGGTNDDRGNSIAVDGSGNVYLTGYFIGTVDFDPGTGISTLGGTNGEDIFFARYTGCSSPQLPTVNSIANPVTISGITSFTDGGCIIVANVQPNGINPLSGIVNARLWIESSVPTFAGQPFVARHYEITPQTNPSTATGRVTLYFTQQEFNDFNSHPASTLDLPTGASDATGIGNLRIVKYNGTSNDNTGLPGSYTNGSSLIDPSDADIIWNSTLNRWEVSFDVTGFSGFIVQTVSSTLPVTLTQFNARKNGSQALLSWTTASEQNNKGFHIQRSANGRDFTNMGFVAARGNGTGANYTFTDAAPLNGRNFYRLLQVDEDGKSSLTEIRMLDFSNHVELRLFPNPAVNQITIDLQQFIPEPVTIGINDIQGRRLKTWTFAEVPRMLQLQVTDLPIGTYTLEIIRKQEKSVHPFIKK